MKKSVIAIAAVIVLVIAAFVVLPFLIPADRIKTQVVEQVKAATGRDLSIEGKVAVSVFPSLSVQVSKVALANPAGFGAKDLIRLGTLDVKLRLLPLLSGRLEVDSFVLIDPVISLEVTSEGQADWLFGVPAVDRPTQNPPAADGKTGGAPLSNIHLGDVRIVNGRLLYVDDKAGRSETMEAINLQVSLTNLDQPLSAKGGLTWRGQAMTLGIDLGKPRVLLEGRGSTPVAVTIASAPAKLSLAGEVSGDDKALSGTVDLSVPSVRGLVTWATGKPLDAPGIGFGPLSVKGKLTLASRRITFSQTALTLDAIKAAGEVAIDNGGTKPQVKAALDVDTLDINPYLPPEAMGKAADGKPAGAAKTVAAGKQDWSDDPIDASILTAAEADLTLNVGAIKFRKIQLGKTRLAVALHGGKLAADLSDVTLYNGGGTGSVTLDGSQPSVAMDMVFSLKGLQAEPFLADAVGFDRIEGTGNFDLQVVGHGSSQRQIVSSLDGKGGLSVLNGAIKGINLASMLRNVSTAYADTGGAQKTDFGELSGTYTIASGIVSNQDMALQAPVLRVGGAGTIDLPKRSINYRITPKVVPSTEGQGGKLDVSSLTVPVIVEGPWDNLSYRPDLSGMLKGGAEKAATDALQKALGKPSGTGNPLPFNPSRLFGK
jgi:AsmA protein